MDREKLLTLAVVAVVVYVVMRRHTAVAGPVATGNTATAVAQGYTAPALTGAPVATFSGNAAQAQFPGYHNAAPFTFTVGEEVGGGA